jgi:hypothetical protein
VITRHQTCLVVHARAAVAADQDALTGTKQNNKQSRHIVQQGRAAEASVRRKLSRYLELPLAESYLSHPRFLCRCWLLR